MDLHISLISAAAKDYNNALHGPLKLCKLQGGWLEKIYVLIINNSYYSTVDRKQLQN